MARRILLILAAFLVLGGAGYLIWTRANPGKGATVSAPVHVGFINPLSGPFAAFGEPVRDGALLAVDEINAQGGVGGRRLILHLEDDAGDPTTSVTAFTKLATVTRVPIVIGPLSSGASMAVAPLADRYQVVSLATLAGTIDLTKAGDFAFRIYPSSEIGSRYIANVAVRDFGARRVAILYPNNAFGVTSRRFVTEVARNAGAQIVAVETYQDGDRQFRTQLTKIRSARPDVILASSYYEEGAQILAQARQLGLNVPVLGEDGWFGPIAGTAGTALRNLYFANVNFSADRPNGDAAQAFVRSFRTRYKRSPNSYAAAGYSAVYVAAQAIERGGATGPGIRDALYRTDMPTAFGRVRFDRNGDNVGAAYALFQLDNGNNPILVTSIPRIPQQ